LARVRWKSAPPTQAERHDQGHVKDLSLSLQLIRTVFPTGDLRAGRPDGL